MTTSDHAITITEAAKRLSVSSRTIERMIKAKKLQAFRAGAGRGVWRIWPAALDLAFEFSTKTANFHLTICF